MGIGERGQLKHHGLGGTRQARECRREHERQQLVGIHVVAQRHGARFVFANGLQHLPKGRVDGALNHCKAKHEHGEDEVVHGEVTAQIDHAEQVPSRHTVQAILPTSERRLHEHEEHELRQRQRHHGEVDTLAANGEHAKQRPQQRGHERTGENTQLGRQAWVAGEQVPGDITAGSEKRRVAE